VVGHPTEWVHSGYREIQELPEQYAIIDLESLTVLCGFGAVADSQQAHRRWVEEALSRPIAETRQSLDGGDRSWEFGQPIIRKKADQMLSQFVDNIKKQLAGN
jgi:hypothetical protein